MTPAGMICIRDALVEHYAELAQRGEIPCAQVPILADLDINQLKGMMMSTHEETIEALLELWTSARERNTRTSGFNKAMVAAAAVLRSHGKIEGASITPSDAKLGSPLRTVLEEVSNLKAVLAYMLGVAETDCLDDKSNVWRSAMIQARDALK